MPGWRSNILNRPQLPERVRLHTQANLFFMKADPAISPNKELEEAIQKEKQDLEAAFLKFMQPFTPAPSLGQADERLNTTQIREAFASIYKDVAESDIYKWLIQMEYTHETVTDGLGVRVFWLIQRKG